LLAVSFTPSVGAQQKGAVDFLNPKLSDPVLEHSKEIYLLNGCAYCHGIDLVARGEAADLMHSAIVASDDNGNILGPLLRSGIPQTAKLSPMPQFSDLSDQEIADIVRWIHYARQQGRYKELTAVQDSGLGNAATGKAYFDQKCSSCHSPTGDLDGLSKKYDSAALRADVLRPKFLDTPTSWKLDKLNDPKTVAARQQHLKFLEIYSANDVANLVAYLGGK
jgi:mono/diheme cytochrome c family protein